MKAPKLSLEYFPPRSEVQQRRFWHTLGCLETLKPAYMSMTWGALGSNSQASLDILTDIRKISKTPVTAHLSCAGQTEAQMRETIAQLEALDIGDFLALRGDLCGTADPSTSSDPTLKYASDLVGLLAEKPDRDISVAAYPEAHPESPDRQSDLKWLKHKLDAGASRAITQFFFDPTTFLRFRDAAKDAGINSPLVPGILPIHDIQKVLDFSSKCGATVPTEIVAQFKLATTAESRQEAAVEQCVGLCDTLMREGVEEFHLYTLNQSTLAYAVGCELMGRRVKSVAAA